MQRNDDLEIQFDEPSHTYTCGGVIFKSVTQTIEHYFSKFEPDKVIANMMRSKNWASSKYYGMTPSEIKKSWEENRDRGTRMHAQIENHILSCSSPTGEIDKERLLDVDCQGEFERELGHFREFVRSAPLEEYCLPEFRIFSAKRKIAGTIDLLTFDSEGNCRIYDWKRVDALRFTNPYQKGRGICEDMDDCNFSHYSLQLNLYRKLLEENYSFQGQPVKIKSMALVLLHPSNDSFLLQEIERDDRI
jgi:ATP-dependent exoDNAse (exonuclease V) beta subunit